MKNNFWISCERCVRRVNVRRVRAREVVDGSIGHLHCSAVINCVAWQHGNDAVSDHRCRFRSPMPTSMAKQRWISIEFSEWTERNGLDAINAHWMRLIALQFRRFGLTQQKYPAAQKIPELTNQNQVNLPIVHSGTSRHSPLATTSLPQQHSCIPFLDVTQQKTADRERRRKGKIGLRHRLRWSAQHQSRPRSVVCVCVCGERERAEHTIAE